MVMPFLWKGGLGRFIVVYQEKKLLYKKIFILTGYVGINILSLWKKREITNTHTGYDTEYEMGMSRYLFIFNKLYCKENRQKSSIPINKNLQGMIYFN